MFSVRNLARPGLLPVTFDLEGGECLTVRGESGSGKTLLLRALADLDPNVGAVSLDGQSRQSMTGPEWRRRVTYVAGEPGWWADTVAVHYRHWDTVAPLIAELGLPDDCRDWPIARLSTGERQRLALARALERNPRVLLLDEPTSGLDEAAELKAEEIVCQRLGEGAGVIWVTHDAAQARRLANRALVVEGGGVREEAL
ncbi:MAG TPA: ATP-binding cassette domain-containing protein [Alphaproteobacteria bacterium]|nr:ATP-binding cassette domain-containing protein [Alphaproteobacteria bacterium]